MEMRDYITIIDGADGQPEQQGAEAMSPHPEQTNAPEQGMDNLDNHSFDVPCGDEGMDGVVSADQTQPDAPDAVVVIPQDGPIVKEDDFDVDPTDNLEFANNGNGSEQNQDQKGLLGEDTVDTEPHPETYENVAEEMRDISDGIAPYLDSDNPGHETEEKIEEAHGDEPHSLEDMAPSVDSEGHQSYKRGDGQSYPETNGFTG